MITDHPTENCTANRRRDRQINKFRDSVHFQYCCYKLVTHHPKEKLVSSDQLSHYCASLSSSFRLFLRYNWTQSGLFSLLKIIEKKKKFFLYVNIDVYRINLVANISTQFKTGGREVIILITLCSLLFPTYRSFCDFFQSV